MPLFKMEKCSFGIRCGKQSLPRVSLTIFPCLAQIYESHFWKQAPKRQEWQISFAQPRLKWPLLTKAERYHQIKPFESRVSVKHT